MTQVIAHRGYSGKYPENTLLAFQQAAKHHIAGLELDVQLTKDREVVICHDETIDRTANGTGLIKDLTLAELKTFDFSGNHDQAPSSAPELTQIPTLREFCEWFKPLDIMVNIELKTNIFPYAGLVPQVIDLVREYRLDERVVLSSFNHHTIMAAKAIQPDIKCGFLTYQGLLEPGNYCRRYGVELYHPHHLTLTDDDHANLAANNVGINTYTVNDPEAMRRLIDKGVTSIITDQVELALAQMS